MADDLMDFQTALQQLQMTEAELSNLVARGDLRVIRSGGKPMFRPADIEGLKKERETEPTIIIPAGGASAAPAESGPITIDLPQDLGIDESAATVVPDQSDTGTEEIVFDESDLEVLPLDEEASQTSALTATDVPAVDDVLTVAEDAAATAVQAEPEYAAIEEAAEDVTASGRRRGISSARRASARAAGPAGRRMSATYDVKSGHAAMTAVLIVAAVLMIFMGSVMTVILVKGYSIEYDIEEPSTDIHVDKPIVKKATARYVPGYLEPFYQKLKDAGEQVAGAEEDFEEFEEDLEE